MDNFAQIAANGIGGRQEFLCTPEPMKFDKKVCNLEDGGSKFETIKKMSTKQELYCALKEIREYYKPFMEDYAPPVKEYNKRQYIDKFILNGDKEISIPEYEGPVGYAKKVYESSFTIDKMQNDKAYYICLMGADYKAFVYINDECVGTHEGFFAPFEFEITEFITEGKNTLKIVLYNDYIYMGNAFATQDKVEGDKLYAATGLGWDDSAEGWHHCPAGMGLYNKVFVEERNKVHISDIFVRPLINDKQAEIWVEINNATYNTTDVSFKLSVFGQNFKENVFENMEYVPETVKTVGMGDSLTEASIKDQLGKGIPMPLKNGINIYKIKVDIKNPKLWELDTPYLYQAQVSVLIDEEVQDTRTRQFGMRDFKQDTENSPKGMYYLNNKKIKLRGANTMGFEQQDVLRGDIDQLVDDMLLAKLCNMNFLRFTQRPVQDEIYDICDKVGLMAQTDLPLFGCMRRTKFAEGVRQAEEMEKMVRGHACSVVVTYINEPFPNANNEPHRHLIREELEEFFNCCDTIIKLNNPDRVIKHVDGDYDPPTTSMPDNHCYPMWYNNHGIDIGRLHKGYWLPVKPQWCYGCGEYGAEGLDFAEVMRESYTDKWLKEPFDPKNIVRAQTGDFHYFFYDTQENMEDWVTESHKFQAFATKMMTEAFRRNPNMVSNAIHLFIDAWPSGWMKTIMDCKRNPKPAYFSYRDALEPVLLSLRTDRFTYFAGETIEIETYICNDTQKESKSLKLKFELCDGDCVVKSGETDTFMNCCDVNYAANAEFVIDRVEGRKEYTLKAILIDENGKELAHNTLNIEVFEPVEIKKNDNVEIISMLDEGEYEIAGEKVKVRECGMLPLHFASRKTGHRAVEEFTPYDFRYWYNKEQDMITPILYNTFEADGFTPILTSGNMDDNGKWHKVLAAAEKEYNGKRYIICQLDLRCENPVAKKFLANLYKLGE